MTRPIYSANFLKTGSQTTGTFDFVVPTGRVASVQGMTAYKATATPACDVIFMIFAPGDATTSPIWIASMPSTTVIQSMVWVGKVVLQAGWTLRAQRSSVAGTWSATASGFLLTSP